ncbi:MAG: hypothetical protein GXO07_03705 [Crenarchaeota archaeon]|nr:hypothetical protein [Thermoproteota archaeon]
MTCPTTVFLLSTIATITTDAGKLPITLVATVSYVNMTSITWGTLSAFAKAFIITVMRGEGSYVGNQDVMTVTATIVAPPTTKTVETTLTSVRPLDLLEEFGKEANITWPSMTMLLPCEETDAYLVTLSNGTIVTVSEVASPLDTRTVVPSVPLLLFLSSAFMRILKKRRAGGG